MLILLLLFSSLSMSVSLDLEAVENFKEYLRIPSVQPNCDYSGCVEFLKKMASGLNLPVVVHEVAPGKPVVVISWVGLRPELPSLLLSSHMDVVPVFEDQWTYGPFSADEDKDGNIYARGAQDMKSVGIQYLEAIRRLLREGFQPNRTIHVSFTPDEEIGSLGMRDFVKTNAFKELNVGCELDEGVANPDESFHFFYGERTNYKITIVCEGTPGHGSLLHNNTAGEKIAFVIDKFMKKRTEEKKKLEENATLTIGDVTSINLTMLKGGVQINVVPPELRVMFDCRVSPNTDHAEFEKWVEDVCKQAGDGVRVEYQDKKTRVEPTKLDQGNFWWLALKGQFEELGLKVNPSIFPASTDARYIRNVSIPAFGFSPMNKTPVKLHDHDEFLNKNIFLKGIDIYCKLISALANAQ